MIKRLIACCILLVFSSLLTVVGKNTHNANNTKPPKNIILLIGDGMGLAQVTAGMYANGNQLNLERFPVAGMIKTHSSSHVITDSAAGATAFSCGCKTYNGAIGVTKDKKNCLTILEQAEKSGLATGLISTSSITHATPASFIAHVNSRTEMEGIAEFFLQTELDFLVGGGLEYFNNRKKDQRNLCTELTKKGSFVSDFQVKNLKDLTPNPQKPFIWFSALGEPDSVSGGRDYLPLAAKMAPDFLKKRSEKGFFLMLEGSQIDWACHAKNGTRAVDEMLDFDAAIGEILRFAEADGNTLVVITADHETGGLALEQGEGFEVLDLEFNTGYHTATMVPVFAFGPGAEQFGGVLDNTDIYWKMAKLWGWVPEVTGAAAVQIDTKTSKRN